MSIFHRKSKFERVLESLESNGALKAAAQTAVESAVARKTSPRQAELLHDTIQSFDNGKPKHPFRRKLRTGAMMAGGVAAVTAVSASISNHRHRQEES